jgi:hypothetical protein
LLDRIAKTSQATATLPELQILARKTRDSIAKETSKEILPHVRPPGILRPPGL